MKKKLRLKPFVVPMMFGFVALAILAGLFISVDMVEDKQFYTYVNNSILDEYIPVINTEDKILKPYTLDKVVKTTGYYKMDGNEEEQSSSIILHDNTYLQNTGINYSSDEEFDIVSILDGEVIEVKDNELLGKSVTIKHEKDVISVYQSLKDVTVKQGDKVLKGQVIAKGGSCNLIKEKENNLHFELYVSSTIVDPEEYFDKDINNI